MSLEHPWQPSLTGPSWLTATKQAAWQTFQKMGLPHSSDERWLNTDATVFADCPAHAADVPDLGLPRITMVDGRWDGVAPDVDGLRVLSIASDDEVPRTHLGQMDVENQDAFWHLNTACFEGGLVLDVKPGANIGPLHVVHQNTGKHAFARILVHAQAGSKVTLLEHYVGGGSTIATTQMHAHRDSTIERDFLIESTGHHLHTVSSQQDAGSTVSDVACHLAASHDRSTVVAKLSGAGAHVNLSGLSLGDGTRASDHWTRVDHAVPDTTSREVYKGVYAGQSRGGFTGNVLVRKDAQRTFAEQENRNLLLSKTALARSTPQLEIHADDVQCSHGSTVGQLDDDALFFLRARGLSLAQAEATLTRAFAGQIVDGLATKEAQSIVSGYLENWFSERRSVTV